VYPRHRSVILDVGSVVLEEKMLSTTCASKGSGGGRRRRKKGEKSGERQGGLAVALLTTRWALIGSFVRGGRRAG